ncbi:MAG: hypothetical protein LBC41_17385 [Clostridiales bacterium]|jgi:flavodoxin|nr:hypothetical protein [Clostridiales bacterium]
MSKAIILYYSRSGTTEKLALRAQSDLNCDILKIEPEDAYGNYVSSLIRVMGDKSKKVTPKFKTPVPELGAYNVILLGCPVWGMDMPDHVAEFLNHCKLKGKTVIPFVTFGRAGADKAVQTLKRVAEGAEIAHPFEYGIFKKDDYDKWIQSVKDAVSSKS